MALASSCGELRFAFDSAAVLIDMNTHPMPVYAGPIQVDTIAPGRERRVPGHEGRAPSRERSERRERRAPYPQSAPNSEGRVARFLRSLWTEEPDEIEVRARRAARLAREHAG